MKITNQRQIQFRKKQSKNKTTNNNQLKEEKFVDNRNLSRKNITYPFNPILFYIKLKQTN